MRQIILLLIAFCTLPLLAQEKFYEHTAVTRQNDTLEFTRFSDKVTLVFTAASIHDGAMQYADLLLVQETYKDYGLVVMELFAEETSDYSISDPTPADRYRRDYYGNFDFSFPLIVNNAYSPLMTYLISKTTPENYVSATDEKTFNLSFLSKPLYKWIINRRGEVVKCFEPAVPTTEVMAALKEVFADY